MPVRTPQKAYAAAAGALLLVIAIVALGIMRPHSAPTTSTDLSSGGAADMNAADRRLLEQFVNDGGDRLAVTTIRFYLYLPSHEAAVRSGSDVAAAGYVYAIEDPLGNLATGLVAQDWLVVARTTAPPSDDLIGTARKTFETIAAKYGGQYDGWEAGLPEH